MIDKKVLEELEEERAYQVAQWGGNDHDKLNTVNDWSTFMCTYAVKAAMEGPEMQKNNLIKVATLAIAAIEALDANGGFRQTHYNSMMNQGQDDDKIELDLLNDEEHRTENEGSGDNDVDE